LAHVGKKTKGQLRAHYGTLNPAELHRRITALQKRLAEPRSAPRNLGGVPHVCVFRFRAKTKGRGDGDGSVTPTLRFGP